MCGFAGFVGPGSVESLRAMAHAIQHRGPDGYGEYSDPDYPVFLAHRRLSIVDVVAGHQPMWNETRDVCVVFNGEIYNHLALRAELVSLGHRFATSHSDTEVLVHGWEEWGCDLPLKLNGMFAFAIFDRIHQKVFLARDRFGEKPLFYASDRGRIAFASELTALTCHPQVRHSVEQRALHKLFGYGYIPAPHALYVGTHKLPGGHWLSYDFSSGETQIKAYWTFALTPDDNVTDDDEVRLVDELEALLVEATRRRLMSDVPLGVFLSGGLDSSLVLAAIARGRPGTEISTFTIGFDEASFDESPFAELVAQHIGTQHHTRKMDLLTARASIQETLARLDEPFADPSILPTALLAQFAREHVTVGLTGDGGDELFAGYDPFAALGPAAVYQRMMPRGGHRLLRKLARNLPKSTANMSFDFKVNRTLMGLSYPENIRMPVWMSPLEPEEMTKLFGMSLRAEDTYDEALELWETGSGRDPVAKSLEFFTRFYLQDDILTKTDRASMMYGLETRAVFLDNDLVSFCQRLPNRFKIRGQTRKYLLKRLAARWLPSAIVDRKKKGFGIPVSQWLQTIPSVPPMAPVDGVNMQFVQDMWSEHRKGHNDRRLFLWTWLSLQATLGHNS